MHEYPITQQIIKIAEKHCAEAGAGKVKKITIVVGDYSGIAAESLSMYFDVISVGTLCEGAVVEVERVRPKLLCPACGELFTREPMTFACPKCSTNGNPTETGKEFYVKEIEVN
jgi:hydrogenase nickel incorporation protein HypA/HybF